jgi:DNA-binding response OmpR family regulator
MKILAVDDDVNLLKLLGHILRGAGFEVLEATSGPQALAAVAQEVPDLALIDVMMPGMDGYELCRRLRSNPRTKRLPIILLTAKVQTEDKIAGLEAGADDYVTKPATPSELIARIKALLRRSAFTAEAAKPKGRITAWVGAKGGVGTTTLAVNVAVLAARAGQRVVLADWQPVPAAATYLGLHGAKGLDELLALEPDQLDARTVERMTIAHNSGLLLLSGSPVLNGGIRAATTAQIDLILEALATNAQHVMLDLGSGLDATSRYIIEKSDRTIAVTEPDRAGIEWGQILMEELSKIRVAGPRVGVILVNRAGSSLYLPRKDIETRLRTPVMALITPAAEPFFQASRDGVPFVMSFPTSPISDTIRAIARAWVEATATPAP